MSNDSRVKSFLFGNRIELWVCPDFCIFLFLSLFVKGIAGKRMVMPGDKASLNHISLSSDITNKGD